MLQTKWKDSFSIIKVNEYVKLDTSHTVRLAVGHAVIELQPCLKEALLHYN